MARTFIRPSFFSTPPSPASATPLRFEDGTERRRHEDEEVMCPNRTSCADMTALDHIHAAGLLANLAQRWQDQGPDGGFGGAGKQPYTFMSVVLISLNPCEWLRNPDFNE